MFNKIIVPRWKLQPGLNKKYRVLLAASSLIEMNLDESGLQVLMSFEFSTMFLMNFDFFLLNIELLYFVSKPQMFPKLLSNIRWTFIEIKQNILSAAETLLHDAFKVHRKKHKYEKNDMKPRWRPRAETFIIARCQRQTWMCGCLCLLAKYCHPVVQYKIVSRY